MYEIIGDGTPRTWAPFTLEVKIEEQERLANLFNKIEVGRFYWTDDTVGDKPHDKTVAHFKLQNAKQVADLMQAGFTPKPVLVNFEIT